MSIDKKKIRFIINPISGIGKQKTVEKLLETHLNLNIFEPEVSYTKQRFHASELSFEAVNQNYYAVVAVGGDGSINEVSKSLVHSNTILGIIPTGSGNGMARFLKIPLDIKKAINCINQDNVISIDSAKLNEHFFVSIAGIGFDALIAHEFAKTKKRGFFPYFKTAIKTYSSFKPMELNLSFNNQIIARKAFLISFANSGQFGFKATIAPQASMNDGLFDVCIMKKIPLLLAPFFVPLLFSNKIHKSGYVEIIKTNEIQIMNGENKIFHVDGDPIVVNESVTSLKILPNSLKIFSPKSLI